MMARRRAPQGKAVVSATVAELERRGCAVRLGFEDELYDLAALPRADVYVVKSRSPFWHSMACALHYLGKPLVNSFDAIQKTQDKIVTCAVLQSAGLPVPRAWTTSSPLALERALQEGALMIKPRLGHRGQGVRYLGVVHDLDDLCLSSDVHVAQRCLPTDAPILKVYGIAERLFAFRKTRTSGPEVGERAELDAEVRKIVLRCREALDLTLYGVDLLYAEGRPFVIDVNLYPGYREIPQAPQLVADAILARLE